MGKYDISFVMHDEMLTSLMFLEINNKGGTLKMAE